MIRRKDTNLNIKAALNMYELEKRAKGLSPASIKNVRDALDMFLKEMEISEESELFVINKESVLEWTRFMQMKDLSTASINAYLGRLRAFVNWCISYDYMPSFKIQLVKGQEQKIKFFTEEELEILCQKPHKDCDYVEYRTWVSICFILATGCRVSTLCNIKNEDINLKERYVVYTHLKNKKSVTVPLSNSICRIIDEYQRMWDMNCDYLFCDTYGNPVSVSAIRQALVKYCKRRGVKPRGPHSLRHSFAREWILKGGGVFQLQQMLCHSDLQMSRKYVNIFCSEIQKDVEEYSALEFFVKNNKKVKRA